MKAQEALPRRRRPALDVVVLAREHGAGRRAALEEDLVSELNDPRLVATSEGTDAQALRQQLDVEAADYAAFRRRHGLVDEAPIHRCPPGDSNLMPCCGRTPFEVPAFHRMTVEPALVTCRG